LAADAKRVWVAAQGGCGDGVRKAIEEVLKAGGFEVCPVEAGEVSGLGVLWLEGDSPHIAELLRELSRDGLGRILVIASSRSVLKRVSPWRLLAAGASDVFAWDHVRSPAAEIRARLSRWAEVDGIVDSDLVRTNLVGRSPAWRDALRRLVEVARFTESSVLITGESGTGKELAARLIHTLDPRPDKKELLILDCTTVVPTLSGSEFFGHERGAFTGAVAARDGAFALADGGTLFLDEVGDLPLALQAEILRVVQEGTYKRVGGNVWRKTRFRLICATNVDLEQEVLRGRFRRDLYHRLASCLCRLPSLRERREDIPFLTRHFIAEWAPGGEGPDVDDAVMEFIQGRDYPGNVRDLKQLVARMISRHEGGSLLTAGVIPAEERESFDSAGHDWRGPAFEASIRRALAQGASLKEITRAASESAINLAVAGEAGNLQRASRRLGVTDRYLQMRRAASRTHSRTSF
jgi:transcriptional regulator with GAF, ATPase, and Fis domain